VKRVKTCLRWVFLPLSLFSFLILPFFPFLLLPSLSTHRFPPPLPLATHLLSAHPLPLALPLLRVDEIVLQFHLLAELPVDYLPQRVYPLLQQLILVLHVFVRVVVGGLLPADPPLRLPQALIRGQFVIQLPQGQLDLLLDAEQLVEICAILQLQRGMPCRLQGLSLPLAQLLIFFCQLLAQVGLHGGGAFLQGFGPFLRLFLLQGDHLLPQHLEIRLQAIPLCDQARYDLLVFFGRGDGALGQFPANFRLLCLHALAHQYVKLCAKL